MRREVGKAILAQARRREGSFSQGKQRGTVRSGGSEGGGKAVPGVFGGRHGEPRKRPGPDVIGHQLTVLRARVPPAAAAVPVAEVEATVAPPPAAGLRTAAPGARARAGAGADTTRPRVAPGSAPSAAKRCVRNCSQPELGGRETRLQLAAGDAFPAASSSTPPVSREKLGVRGTPGALYSNASRPPPPGLAWLRDSGEAACLYNCGFLGTFCF